MRNEPRMPTRLRTMTLLALLAAAPPACRAQDARHDAGARPADAGPSEDWPVLPRDAKLAADLVAARTHRPPAAETSTPIDAPLLLARLAQPGPAGLVAGAGPIRERLQEFLDGAARAGRDAWLLWGVRHDSGEQVDAFRRLLGPDGLRGLDLAAAETFLADGRWRGVPLEAQAGDDDDIGAWLGTGDAEAFRRLAARHPASDYAAWKFGTTANVLDLLIEARAVRLDFHGCNMPRALQERTNLSPLGDDRLRLRLRELHCLLALGSLPRPRRAAVLWGADHVAPDGFPRFLPRDAAVLAVTVFGYRPGEETVEDVVGRSVMVADPLLVPLDDAGAALALLLPDRVLGGDVDRARAEEPATDAGRSGVRVTAEQPARLRIAGRVEDVGPVERRIELPEGEHTYVLEAGALRIVGLLDVRPAEARDLVFDPAERFLDDRRQAVRP
jgi:hypothetical protein